MPASKRKSRTNSTTPKAMRVPGGLKLSLLDGETVGEPTQETTALLEKSSPETPMPEPESGLLKELPPPTLSLKNARLYLEVEKELSKADSLQLGTIAAETLQAFGVADPYGWWGSPAGLGSNVRLQLTAGGELHPSIKKVIDELMRSNPYFTPPSLTMALVRMAAVDLVRARAQTNK